MIIINVPNLVMFYLAGLRYLIFIHTLSHVSSLNDIRKDQFDTFKKPIFIQALLSFKLFDAGVTCWPTLLVLSPTGVPIHVFIGEGHSAFLQEYVETALAYYRGLQYLLTYLGLCIIYSSMLGILYVKLPTFGNTAFNNKEQVFAFSFCKPSTKYLHTTKNLFQYLTLVLHNQKKVSWSAAKYLAVFTARQEASNSSIRANLLFFNNSQVFLC